MTTRLRNVSERHQSIQTVFDQTWLRLDKREQEVFKCLSVFRGGFLRDAAVAVAGASLPILSTLVDKSLLSLGVSARYQIHELLRQYAAEQFELPIIRFLKRIWVWVRMSQPNRLPNKPMLNL